MLRRYFFAQGRSFVFGCLFFVFPVAKNGISGDGSFARRCMAVSRRSLAGRCRVGSAMPFYRDGVCDWHALYKGGLPGRLKSAVSAVDAVEVTAARHQPGGSACRKNDGGLWRRSAVALRLSRSWKAGARGFAAPPSAALLINIFSGRVLFSPLHCVLHCIVDCSIALLKGKYRGINHSQSDIFSNNRRPGVALQRFFGLWHCHRWLSARVTRNKQYHAIAF